MQNPTNDGPHTAAPFHHARCRKAPGPGATARQGILLAFILGCAGSQFSGSTLGETPKAKQLRPLLEASLLDEDVTLNELRAFLRTRIPQVPRFSEAEAWEDYSEKLRTKLLDEVVYRGEARKWRDQPTRVVWLETIEGGPEYVIKKLRYEAVPGLWIPALLYEPKGLESKVPVVMNVNGHERRDGKAADYKQMRCINQAKRGMLALNVEWLGMGQLNAPGYSHYLMNQLDLCGTSGLAPFYLSMKRGLDVLLEHPHADPQRVAVAGLSGGGWQTIVISALDPRVTLSNPVAGYSSFLTRIDHTKDLGDSEQTPCDLAKYADYTHLTAMLAPRAALLTYNSKDNCCFESGYALPPLVAAAEPVYRLFDRSPLLRTHVNEDPGTHNFERDNREALYQMFADHFFRGDKSPRQSAAAASRVEIDAGAELKEPRQLAVALPDDNADFPQLVARLIRDLPRSSEVPAADQPLARWRTRNRAVLRKLVRYAPAPVTVKESRTGMVAACPTAQRTLGIGDWTVPVTESAPANVPAPELPVVVLMGDQGRGNLAEPMAEWLAKGHRVLAVDQFYFGECGISQRDFLYALLVSAVGERPLGLQASQLGSIIQWAAGSQDKSKPPRKVIVDARGPRSSLQALVAAAADPDHLAKLQLHGAWASLREPLEAGAAANTIPELFCFGLLERFDLPQLKALAGVTVEELP